ncbi:hypothetical protein EWB00_001041 [Schistosoma japonicum]|uniref:Uncharacterized protein n=1 Tax=Schistosoma japonicum TaxID=6182 RepID=A0A4Z2DH40_SCHJA|nr:hypothetical protein EWB00_001041 [Schistosoma japonicum]
MKLKSPSTSYISNDFVVLETLKRADELQLDVQSNKHISHVGKSNQNSSSSHNSGIKLSIRKFSLSIPSKLNDEINQNVSKISDSTQNYQQKMKEKKKFSFRRLIGKFEETSRTHLNGMLSKSQSDVQIDANNQQIESELEFAHKLMNSPEEMGLNLEGRENEVDCCIQTICEPCTLSKIAINFDRLLRRIDTTNARVTTLINLCTTAILASDKTAINFLVNSLKRMRRKQNVLINEADDIMLTFLKDPLVLLRSKKTAGKSNAGVTFSITYPEDDDDDDGDDDEDKEDNNDEVDSVKVSNTENKCEHKRTEESQIHWELSSSQLSTDYSTSDSDNDGPTPEYVLNLSKQIRKTEGTRLKQNLRLINRKKSSNMGSNKGSFNVPPPLNPLGHNRNDLLRSHATVASGLCQQSHKISTSSMLSMNGLYNTDVGIRSTPTLPFNLLSLTGQLSWLISEYIERGSTTYKWATELINSIGKMSVTRSTWLNVHQQLRETTELLYSHRDQQLKKHHSVSETSKGEISWNKLQALHQSILDGDLNSCTITSGNLKTLCQSSKQINNERKLVQLSCLLEKKLHLAYLCDLLLWKAHKLILAQFNYTDEDIVKCQSMDFQIRLFELQLDQLNGQNWSSNLMDSMLCWISDICEWKVEFNPSDSDIDYFMWNEFYVFKSSVQTLLDLVKSLNACKLIRSALDEQNKNQIDMITNNYGLSSSLSNVNLEDNQSKTSSDASVSSKGQLSHRSTQNYHPHQSHHSQGDFRTLDADRCSRSYAALIRQIQENAMNNRPLAYFAERALYDIAVELGCNVNWDERFDSLSKELQNAWQEWDLIIREKIDRDF